MSPAKRILSKEHMRSYSELVSDCRMHMKLFQYDNECRFTKTTILLEQLLEREKFLLDKFSEYLDDTDKRNILKTEIKTVREKKAAYGAQLFCQLAAAHGVPPSQIPKIWGGLA